MALQYGVPLACAPSKDYRAEYIIFIFAESIVVCMLALFDRVISGHPVAKPPIIGLCCEVARRVIDKFGAGVAESEAGSLVEALVMRLGLGITGDLEQEQHIPRKDPRRL